MDSLIYENKQIIGLLRYMDLNFKKLAPVQ